MELLKSGFIKDFKLDLKTVEEEKQKIFKYLKKYYNNDSYYFIIKKEEKESITIHKLEKLTNVLFSSLDIMYYRWHSVEELTPAEAKGYNQTQREEVNNYDLKNNWDFTHSNIIVLALKMYNTHNKNGFNPNYLQQLYNSKKLSLQQKAYSIRAEKARQERERKRKEQEAQTNDFKKVVLCKITSMIKNAASQEKDKETMQLLRLKERINNTIIIEKNIQDCLNPDTLLKEVYVKCKTRSNHDLKWFITDFKVPFIELILEGAYSLMLKHFKECNNGLDWYYNTDLFQIIEASDIVDVNINHEYIK